MEDSESILEEHNDAAKLARHQELEDIKLLMSSGAGQRFMKRLMEDGKIFSTSFTGNSQTFFLEGHRNLALKYFKDICEACPEKVRDLLINEQEDEQ